ncbi:MAG: CHAT domain-containing protein [Tildeniella torsiva UHER 1998/13D]|jgi:hypothetical protein|nr:CHAT domain-containing protein [Tildeniella torsiva UHER 1998/13D]
MNPIKVLVLTANPNNTGSELLGLDAEVRRIEEAFRRSHHRDRFQIVTKLAARPADLRQALLEYRPQIIHFSGHGTETQGLVLENDQGKVQLVSTEALGRLFGAFDNSPIECVLLNACYSEVQANAIHQYVDCVIGMNRPIGDQAAIQFSQGFYDALGAGSTYAEAFNMGCSAIHLEGGAEYLTPKLIGGKGGRAISPVGQGLQAPEPTATDGGTVRPAQSQSIGNVTISGSNNPFNAIQAGGNVNLSQTSTQTSGSNPDLEAALTLLAKLQQEVAATDALTSFAKKDTGSKIVMLQEELQKPEPDKGFVKEVVDALKQGLDGVITLAEPVTQVAGLVAKALMFTL